ncbi:MAG: hypothetical protein AAF591_20720 [Verrucomicrobiota bacterium]
MESVLRIFIDGVSKLDWSSVATISVLGIILILVNAITHFFKERISDRVRVSAAEADILASATEPIRRRADNLTARLSNLLIDWASPEDVKTLQDLLNSEDMLDQRLQGLTPTEMTWIEVLAFRFLEFLWAVERFRKETEKLINNPDVSELEYFLVDKLPLAMRGKVYYSGYFTREEQEELSLFFHDVKLSSIEGPTLRDLCELLKEEQSKRKLFAGLLSYLCLDPKGYNDLCRGNYDSEDARQLCAIAHFTVYLIDVFQKLAHSSKWEEYRILFVRVIMRANDFRDTKAYLYFRKDVGKVNYLFSYPENILKRYWWTRWLTRHHSNPYSKMRHWAFYWCLRLRARRFMYRHHKKRLTKDGIKIHADGKPYTIDLKDGLGETRDRLIAYLRGSGRRMPRHLETNNGQQDGAEQPATAGKPT